MSEKISAEKNPSAAMRHLPFAGEAKERRPCEGELSAQLTEGFFYDTIKEKKQVIV